MRYYEITSGMRIPVSSEESDILSMIEDAGHIFRETLDDRQKEVARQMVTRGILIRSRKDNKAVFSANSDPTLRRF